MKSEYWARTKKRLEAFDRTAPKWLRDGVAGNEGSLAKIIASFSNDTLIIRRYRHYKGNTYTVLHEAEDAGSDARGRVIVYRGEDGRVWTRPASEFYDTVTVGGTEVSRFTPISAPVDSPLNFWSDPFGEY